MSYYCVPITVFIALSLFAGAAAREVSLKTSADDLLTVEGVDWGTSGYLPIKTMRTAGQLFYTYCPPRNGDENAPLIFWLQGGPGASGIAWGLLQEHGPFQLVDGKPVHREISWNNEFGVLYIDQPVGTGFSTAASNDSYAQNEYDVAEGLLDFLMKWADLGLWNRANPLFIAGESYGGHYVPALAHHMITTKTSFNLKGIAIGDGLTDPAVQVLTKPKQALAFGLIDLDLLPKVEALAQSAAKKCMEEDYLGAGQDRAAMEDVVTGASGINPMDVRRFGGYSREAVAKWLNDPRTKAKLNVPTEIQFDTDYQVMESLADDVMRSWAFVFPELLEALPVGVLLFQGQFDWKDGVTSNEAWVSQIDWQHAKGFHAANRSTWTMDGLPKGWGKSFHGLTEVVVAGSGHMVPMDQPEACLRLITAFIRGESLFEQQKTAVI